MVTNLVTKLTNLVANLTNLMTKLTNLMTKLVNLVTNLTNPMTACCLLAFLPLLRLRPQRAPLLLMLPTASSRV